MSRWWLPLLVSMVFVSCTSAPTVLPDDAESGIDVVCLEPPASELAFDAATPMSVSPDPVASDSTVALTVELGDLDPSAINGTGLHWQCWNGQEWVTTHLLHRGLTLMDPVIYEPSDPDRFFADVGLPLPNTHDILVPDVLPGTYRIRDVVFSNGDALEALLAVEVVDP